VWWIGIGVARRLTLLALRSLVCAGGFFFGCGWFGEDFGSFVTRLFLLCAGSVWFVVVLFAVFVVCSTDVDAGLSTLSTCRPTDETITVFRVGGLYDVGRGEVGLFDVG